jgi:DNA-binding response OmpR family regulator
MEKQAIFRQYPHRYVLVIDSNPHFTATFSKLLLREGLDPLVVSTHEEALLQLETYDFRLIVLDISPKSEDGWSFLETLRAQCPSSSIVVMTGVYSEHAMRTAMKLGASGYAFKTSGLANMVLVLRNVLWQRIQTLKQRFKETPRQLDLVAS